MRTPFVLILALAVASCAQDDAAQSPTTPPTPATTTTPAPAATATPTPTAPTPAPKPPPALVIEQVTASIVTATVAENELGKQVAPSAEGAVAIDLQFELLPGRALDPVLEIGGVTFRNYETRPGGVLRFVVASPALAEAGEVVLRWGRDNITVATQLQVTR